MNLIELGRSGLKVTPICFGTWEFSGEWGAFDEATAIATIRDARERGINFFDTAHAYGFGIAERILGTALAGELRSGRDELVIATKGGLRRQDDRLLRDSSPGSIRSGVDDSMRALGVDFIDLYQLHWPDPNTPYEATAEVLSDLIDNGKIRHAGVSNFDISEMHRMDGFGLPETLQPPYHMFRRAIEERILPYCDAQHIGVLAYGALAHGLLSGAMTTHTTFALDDWRSRSSDFAGKTFERNLDVVSALEQFTRNRGYTLAQLAVAWTLANPAVDVAIVGTGNTTHLAEALDAASITLEPDDLAEIDRILAAAAPVRGPSPEGS